MFFATQRLNLLRNFIADVATGLELAESACGQRKMFRESLLNALGRNALRELLRCEFAQKGQKVFPSCPVNV